MWFAFLPPVTAPPCWFADTPPPARGLLRDMAKRKEVGADAEIADTENACLTVTGSIGNASVPAHVFVQIMPDMNAE